MMIIDSFIEWSLALIMDLVDPRGFGSMNLDQIWYRALLGSFYDFVKVWDPYDDYWLFYWVIFGSKIDHFGLQEEWNMENRPNLA